MDHLQFVDRVDFGDLDRARRFLKAHHAFADPEEDIKLRMPREDSREETHNDA